MQQEAQNKIVLLHLRREHLALQTATHEARYELADEIYKRWSEHASTVVSGYQISQQHDQVLQLRAQLEALRDQRLQLDAELAQTEAALRMIPVDLLKDVAELKIQLSDVMQLIATSEKSRGIVLRATQDGVVSTVLVKEGQYANPSKLLLTVMPKQEVLLAEVWVPGNIITQLKPGTPIDLHYDVSGAGIGEWVAGKVHELGGVALSPIELSKLLGSEQKTAAYRVTVEIPSQDIDGSRLMTYTNTITAADIDGMTDESLMVCPVIYQRFIQKAYDVRVVTVGNNIFACRLDTPTGTMDFRPLQGTSELTFSRMEMSISMTKAVRSLTEYFSLKLASSDFVVNESGDFYFLDLNPGGAFLFVEFHTHYPITAHVAALLGGGDPKEYHGLHAYNELATNENMIGAV